MGDKQITISEDELESRIQIRVNQEKLIDLEKIVVKHIEMENRNWDEVFKRLSDVPGNIQRHRDEIEDEIDKRFARKADMVLLETQLGNKIDSINNKLLWAGGTIVALGGIIQYFLAVYVNISKLGGG